MDTELSNLRSGISLTPGVGDGSDKGVAYMEEYLYHDKSVCDRKVIYLKSDTQIALAYNEFFNVVIGRTGVKWEVLGSAGGYADELVVGASTLPAGPGIIRYRVDKDWNFSSLWSGPLTKFPAYTAPFTLASLEYETGVSVVGTTGDNGQAHTKANRANYYHRGMLDEFGDEWHALHVGSDNSLNVPLGKGETFCSAGKEFLLVVNPKTPCLTVRATGNAEFHTTRPKAYRVPKIHAQTTTIVPGTGTVTFELRNLYAGNVFYRIVSNPADAVTAYTDAGANNVTLSDSQFSGNSTHYLQYYYAGNAAYTKTRVIIKNPTHPSLGEGHSTRIFGSEAARSTALARVSRSPYLAGITELLNSSELRHGIWDSVGESGHRWPWGDTSQSFGGAAAQNAFVGFAKGWSYALPGEARSCGSYAKSMLLNGTFARIQDPVGFEQLHSTSSTYYPSAEWISAGYYCFRTTIDMLTAYTLIAGNYRSDQEAGGLTVCEDLYIRDVLASIALQGVAMLNGQITVNLGMWYNSWACGAGVIGMVMPSYNSPVFGTSGYDGVTTATHTDTPFPSSAYTWKEYISDRSPSVGTYPDYCIPFDFGGALFESDGDWKSPSSLAYFNLCRPMLQQYMNLEKRCAPEVEYFPSVALALQRSALGTMDYTGNTGAPTNAYYSQPMIGNSYVDFGGTVVSNIKAFAGTVINGQTIPSESNVVKDGGVWALLWYDDTTPAQGAISLPVFTPASDWVFESAPSITITTSTAAATIHYTLNDSGDPNESDATYTSPITLSSTATIKAFSRKTGLLPSAVRSETYTIDTTRPAPVRNPSIRFSP